MKFQVKLLHGQLSGVTDEAAVAAFRHKVARLRGAVRGTIEAANETAVRLKHIHKTLVATPDADPALAGRVAELQAELEDLLVELRGDPTKSKRWQPEPPSVAGRVGRIVGSLWDSTVPPTATQEQGYEWAEAGLASALARLHRLVEKDVAGIEQRLQEAGAPWTPGRIPVWR